MGAAFIKYLVKILFTIKFIHARQAASRTVKPRCLAFTPVSERSRFPVAPYLATSTCLLRDSAPPTGGVGSLLKLWNDAEKPGDKGSAECRASCAHHWAYSIFFICRQWTQMSRNMLGWGPCSASSMHKAFSCTDSKDPGPKILPASKAHTREHAESWDHPRRFSCVHLEFICGWIFSPRRLLDISRWAQPILRV